MGFSIRWIYVLVLSLLGLIYYTPIVRGQHLQETDALCTEKGCFVVYFQRKTFLDSWRSCKEQGGNLATVKQQEEADTIAALFSNLDLRGSRSKVQVWIGLQRQPRQCSASQPLRGFSWTTGDQDTQYTNWGMSDPPNTCLAPRCVAMTYGRAEHEQHNNFIWLHGSCSVPVDGYLCRYTYKGMCPAIWSEGGGNTFYSTPFSLLSTLLTHVPFGSLATVPCPEGTKKEQSVLCTSKENGTVGWSLDAPLCSDTATTSWCDRENGGCEHFCRKTGKDYYCECSYGFRLGDDGQTCEADDPCHEAPCEFECLPLQDGHRCACPEGYMLAQNEHNCLDIDECMQSPCEQLCINAPGSFECGCREGYLMDDRGDCEDVDECMDEICEHDCENTAGSHKCHCNLGFSPVPEDPSRCQDTDECQIPGTCQQMCVNSEGGFECFCEVGFELLSDQFSCGKIREGKEGSHAVATSFYPWVTPHPGRMWDSQEHDYHYTPEQTGVAWQVEEEQLDWLTDPPRMVSEVIWDNSDDQENRNHPMEELVEDDKDGEEGTPGWYNMYGNTPAEVQPEMKLTPFPSPTPNTTPAPTPTDYIPEEGEDETTTGLSDLPTTSLSDLPTTSLSDLPSSTVVERAWNWRWSSPSADSQDQVVTTESITTQHFPTNHNDDDTDDNKEVGDLLSESVTPLQEFDMTHNENQDQNTTTLSLSPAFQTPITHEHGVVDEVEVKGEREPPQEGDGSQKQGGGSWLLIGLLVPILIFIVVMLVLGIIYCTRYAATQRNKNATDCYHWISGAHDKQGAPNPSKGMQSHV